MCAIHTYPLEAVFKEIGRVRGRSGAERIGLVNLGNTCYLNCALQALFMVPPLLRHLLVISVLIIILPSIS